MKCNVCKGTGKVEVEGMKPDEFTTEKCDVCMGKGERDVYFILTVWDADNDREITSEDVPLDYEQACEVIARQIKYAQEN